MNAISLDSFKIHVLEARRNTTNCLGLSANFFLCTLRFDETSPAKPWLFHCYIEMMMY